MAIGISTSSFFSRLKTEEALDYIGKNLSSNNIKNNTQNLAEVFLESSSEYTQEFAKLLKDIAQKNNTKICSVHAMSSQFEPQLFSIGYRQKQDAIKVFTQALQVGQTIGAKKYVFHGPALLKGALKNADITRIAGIACELSSIAKDYNIKLCWENVSWCMFSRPDFAENILENIEKNKSDNLFFTLDIKQAVRSGFDVFSYIKTMGEKLSHVHLCDYSLDNNNKLDKLFLPGEGEFDFEKLNLILKKNSNYSSIDFIVEVYSDLYESKNQVLDSYYNIKNILE